MVSRRSKPGTRPKKSVPPSRLRYEAANPSVTVRLPRELRDKLAELKETHGLSLGDVVRIGLELAKPDLDAAYLQGLNEGFALGEEEFSVPYYCSRCRHRHLTITTDREKEAAARLMCQAGWHSKTCQN